MQLENDYFVGAKVRPEIGICILAEVLGLYRIS